jgi:hypothetical protein
MIAPEGSCSQAPWEGPTLTAYLPRPWADMEDETKELGALLQLPSPTSSSLASPASSTGNSNSGAYTFAPSNTTELQEVGCCIMRI